jgi:hypothetical protein
LEVMRTEHAHRDMINELRIIENEKLWTWSDRLRAEIEAVRSL